MASAVVDSNVLLRHTLQDHLSHSEAASALLRRIETGEVSATLTSLAIAEAVWVLQGPRYRLPRALISETLSQMAQITNLDVPEQGLILEALDLYAVYNIDFADCYHSAVARSQGGSVHSFDRDFDRVPDITRIEPAG